MRYVYRTLASSVLILTSVAAIAEDHANKKFDGFYTGLEIGVSSDNFISLLRQPPNRETSLYYGGLLGFRKQIEGGWVFGIEGTFGDTGFSNTGDFPSPVPIDGIDFDGISQTTRYEWSAGITVGKVFGADHSNLFFAKAAHVRTGREFIDINRFISSGIRFGLGYEKAISKSLSLRITSEFTDQVGTATSWAAKSGLIFKF
ncbi:MAG: hypothetical protein JKY60_17630 [Kordiimonadaceae bacterium]|nr:hypothetical protein [Kordiimonadaceae bacterium]